MEDLGLSSYSFSAPERTSIGSATVPTNATLQNDDSSVQNSTELARRVFGDYSDSGDEEEKMPNAVKPSKSRLIDRLQAAGNSDSDDSSQEGTEAPQGSMSAYERIRRELMGTATDKNRPQQRRSEQTRSPSPQSSPDTSQSLQKRHMLKRKRDSTSAEKDADSAPGLLDLERSPDRSKEGQLVPNSNQNQNKDVADDSESDDSVMPSENPRLQALVARKRQERIEKERAAGRYTSDEEADGEQSDSNTSKKKVSTSKLAQRRIVTVEAEDDDDLAASHKLTQQARPTRKASKKALEEMHRETQRMSRNQQLAHQAKTKTKFTANDFFAKFNFKPKVIEGEAVTPAQDEQTSSSPPHSTDGEAVPLRETPPSSPPSVVDKSTAAEKQTAPTVEQRTSVAPPEISLVEKPPAKKLSFRKLEKMAKRPVEKDDSDDDLEIVRKEPSRLPVFDSIPATKAKDSYSLLQLRALAHLSDRTAVRGVKAPRTITSSELNASLHQRARRQALLERDEKIQRLREKGVIIQTAEEKEREQLQIENLLEKARKEDEALAKREKEAAKAEGGEGDISDSDDEEWEEGNEEAPEVSEGEEEEEEEEEIELSGSEDEEGENDIEESAEAGSPQRNPMFDEEASSDDDAEPEEKPAANQTSENDLPDMNTISEIIQTNRLRARKVVTSDDEGEEQNEANINKMNENRGQTSVIGNPQADLFGFDVAKPAGLGLSQVFAGTMAESQTQTRISQQDDQQDSLAFLRNLPVGEELNIYTPVMPATQDVQDLLVQDSQTQAPSHESGLIRFDTQSQILMSNSQMSGLPEATQDIGFQVLNSQITQHDASYATVDTIMLDGQLTEGQYETTKKKSRLRRRVEIMAEEDRNMVEVPDVEPISSHNAFLVMQDASKKPSVLQGFDKKHSDAKNMVEEQAEESEDEYAGLGGASDDESTGELDEETKKLIDDDSNEKLNEREIAAFHANNSRVDDEKKIAKLYKDVINGGLRRKRGAEMDLWDSDDEDEAAARRRANKQREFARMRKALLADEKLGKIAENPKQAAFLHAIEDREEEDDLDILETQPQESTSVSQVPDSQGQGNAHAEDLPAALRSVSGNSNKRSWAPFAEDTSKEPDQQVPASQEENSAPVVARRRVNLGYTKPTSLADIRNTLSELIGERESAAQSQDLDPDTAEESDFGGSGEDEDELDEEDRAFIDDTEDPIFARPAQTTASSRRAPATAARSAVIDRMALRRAASSSVNPNHSTTNESSDRLAFVAPTSASFSFRAPSLLRRASTANSTDTIGSGSAAASRGVTQGEAYSATGMAGSGVKMGGTKKSSVNYYVREQERRLRLEIVEKERIESRERVGKLRRTGMNSAIGVLAGGKFE